MELTRSPATETEPSRSAVGLESDAEAEADGVDDAAVDIPADEADTAEADVEAEAVASLGTGG